MIGAGIPVLRVAGSHREVGQQVGEACADVLREAVTFDAEGNLSSLPH